MRSSGAVGRPSLTAAVPGWLILAGGLILALGSFLPWGFSGDLFEPKPVSGFGWSVGQHGAVPLIAGIVLFISGVAFVVDQENPPTTRVVAVSAAAGLLLVAALAIVFIVDFRNLADLGSSPSMHPMVGYRGIGLYSVAAGTAVALIGFVTLVSAATRRREDPSSA